MMMRVHIQVNGVCLPSFLVEQSNSEGLFIVG